jgi:hypothetical protein
MKTASRATPTSKNSTHAERALAPIGGRGAGPNAGRVSLSPVAWIALVALVLLGVTGNLLRVTCWTQADGFIRGPFGHSPAALPPTAITRYTRIEQAAPAWRPLRVEIQARARPADGSVAPPIVRGTTPGSGGIPGIDAIPGFGMIEITLDGEDQPPQVVSANWRPAFFLATRPAAAPGVLTVAVSVPPASQAGRITEVAAISLTPVLAIGPLLRHAATGALFGLMLWSLMVWRPAPTRQAAPREMASIERVRREEGIAPARIAPERNDADRSWRRDAAAAVRVGAAIFALFAVWALIRPPNQTPDEPHHFIRVTSILEGPWVAGADRVAFDPRFLNPLTWAMPTLARVAFNVNERVSRADIHDLEAMQWSRVREVVAPGGSLYAAIVSYPPLYYASLFAIAQPIVSLSGASPYQAYYLYRLGTALLTMVAWVAVYVLLRRTRETAASAGAMIALLVLNPMLAYMSSGVNADALSVPLIALATIAAWRTLATGAQPWLTCATAVAALLTKPSGAQMAAAVIVASAWCAWRGLATWRHAWLTGRAVAIAGLVSYGLFYAWSPTHFYPEPGYDNIGLGQYLAHVLGAIPDVWISFWGYLGWLEYRLPAPWYAALFAIVILCGWWRWRAAADASAIASRRLLPEYLIVYVSVFLASMVVGGFLNLRVAGYMLQGRYFLPVAIGLAPLVMQDTRWQRWTLPAAVALLNVALMWETVWRYYGGDWSLLWLSFPF